LAGGLDVSSAHVRLLVAFLKWGMGV